MMMNKLRQSSYSTIALLIYAFMPLALSGCLGLSDGSELIPPEATGAPTSYIQVGTGTTPKYSWLVGNISSLFVVRVADPLNPVWGLGSRGAADIIPSPITHGQSLDDPNLRDIPNLQIISSTEPVLTAGVEYRVTITTQGGFKQYSVSFIPPDGTTSVPSTTPGNSLTASTHSLLLNNGKAWAWGSNQNGQLGDGITMDSSTPLAVNGLDHIIAIASGGAHSLAVTADGTVWSWGANGSGQLGTGRNADSAVPIQVPDLSGISAVAAGDEHSLALGSDGKVWAWGENSSGQLGDGTTVNRNRPVQVESLTDIVAIAAGKVHSMALARDGTLWSWGGNYNGQLGDGTVANSTRPVKIGK
jgi:hypothetical protein